MRVVPTYMQSTILANYMAGETNLIIIYTTKNCPDCKALKAFLDANNIEYEEKDLENKNVMADLVMENIATQSSPIIKIGNLFFEIAR